MNAKNKHIIEEYAEEHDDVESCGFLIAQGDEETVYFATNSSEDPGNQFRTTPEDWLKAQDIGEITAIFHSHVNGGTENPSMPDRVACNRTEVPWWIYSTNRRRWSRMIPNGYKTPLLGREWCYGVLDCYTLIQDWYGYTKEDDKLAPGLGIKLPDLYRVPDEHDQTYQDGFNKVLGVGFVLVPKESLREHDLIMMAWIGEHPHHGAVYIGGNMLIHQLTDRLSLRQIYTGGYRDRTAAELLLRGRGFLRVCW